MAHVQRYVSLSRIIRYPFATNFASFHTGSVYNSAKYKDTISSPASLNVIHGNIKALPSNVQTFIAQRMHH